MNDQTGLTGRYDFTVEWEIDQSVFSALQEQLGLRAESRKGPVDVLVIDSVGKTPTEN